MLGAGFVLAALLTLALPAIAGPPDHAKSAIVLVHVPDITPHVTATLLEEFKALTLRLDVYDVAMHEGIVLADRVAAAVRIAAPNARRSYNRITQFTRAPGC